jgi:gamma-glutamyltranspeptidase/glutathione hydrolase
MVLALLASPGLAGKGQLGERAGSGMGLVSASHPLAAEAGAQMLRRGGNAIDAAAATQFALNVVEPQFSGIGGGGFMMVYLAGGGQIIVLDGRETAPAASTPDQFLGPDGRPFPFAAAHVQGTAVGVPGTLLNVATALERFGTMSLAETLEPALDLAENGFPINAFLAADIRSSRGKLAAWPDTAALFLPGGRPLQPGELLRQPDLARTFRLIREGGPDVFYRGEIGQALVATHARRGGRMTMDDLASYQVKEREPIIGGYREYQVAAMPPPSSGGLTLLHMLQLLEPAGLRETGHNTAPTLHLMIEAMRLAYADRGRYMADADFVAVPVRGLLDPAYVESRRALIDPARANPAPEPGDPFAYESASAPPVPASATSEDGLHTTHFVVVDGEGNVVSHTSTIEAAWGTGMVVPGYGFLLNNELTDFDFVPGGPNQVEPGKRPRSSMSPTIVLRDGQPVMALGSPGGPTIITTVMQVLLNVLEHGMDLQAAIDAGRVFSSSYPRLAWEAQLEPGTVEALRALGHAPAAAPTRLGSMQAALRGPSGEWTGGADSRREGTVVYVTPLAARRVGRPRTRRPSHPLDNGGVGQPAALTHRL